MFGIWALFPQSLTAKQRVSLYSGVMCMSGCMFGFDTGSIGSITTMTQFTDHFGELSEFMRGFVVSVILLPSALTGCVGGRVSDKISRKYTIAMGCAIFALGYVIALLAPRGNLAMLIVGRCIAGSGEGFFLSATTVYLCEICPANRRARAVCGFQLAICGAISAGFFICYGTQHIQSNFAWRLPMILSIGLATFVALAAPFMPYSPRWLVMHGRKEEAVLVLDLLTGPEDAVERAEMLAVPPAAANAKYWDMFQRGVRGRTFLGLVLNVVQMLSGIDFVLFYAPTLFAQAGLSGDSGAFIASGVTGIMLVVATLAGTLIVDHFGRRQFVVGGGSVIAFSLISIGGMYASGAAHGRIGKWFIVLLIELFAFTFGLTWAIVIRLYTAEIMPARTRSSASSLGTGINQLVNTAIALTSPAFLAKSSYGPYFLYGVLMSLGTLCAYLFMPETRGKSLESIDVLFEGNPLAVKLPAFPFKRELKARRASGAQTEGLSTGVELRQRRPSRRRSSGGGKDAEGRPVVEGRRGLERLGSDSYVPGESAIAEDEE